MDSLYESDFSNFTFPFRFAINYGESPYLYHWHDEIEIIHVLDEYVDIGVDRTLCRLETGDILFVASGVRHCFYSAPKNARRAAFKFAPSLLETTCGAELETLGHIPPISHDWNREFADMLGDTLSAIRSEAERRQPGWQTAVSMLLHRIVLDSVRHLPLESLPARSFSRKAESIKRILTYLSEHYMENVTLQSCAFHVGFNPNYLSRLFYQQTGAHFHEYLQILRLRKVEWMLLNTRDTVLSIAEKCGYPNVKNLNRVFKRKWGISPSAFRAPK